MQCSLENGQNTLLKNVLRIDIIRRKAIIFRIPIEVFRWEKLYEEMHGYGKSASQVTENNRTGTGNRTV